MTSYRHCNNILMLITLIWLFIWGFIKLIVIVEKYVGFSNIFSILLLASVAVGSLIALYDFFRKLFKGGYNERIYNFMNGILFLGFIALIFWGLFTIFPNGIIRKLLSVILFLIIIGFLFRND
jgi:hypothetical protein